MALIKRFQAKLHHFFASCDSAGHSLHSLQCLDVTIWQFCLDNDDNDDRIITLPLARAWGETKARLSKFPVRVLDICINSAWRWEVQMHACICWQPSVVCMSRKYKWSAVGTVDSCGRGGQQKKIPAAWLEEYWASFSPNLTHSSCLVPTCWDLANTSRGANVKLHGFSNASENAHAAVVYLLSYSTKLSNCMHT